VTADFPDGPAGDPGLDRLLSVLTSGGTEEELEGRDQALAMFRSARLPSARLPSAREPGARLPAGEPGAAGDRAHRVRSRGRLRVSGLTAVAATILLALGGTTAAAYAAALPAPMQRIVHNVLAPLGVPNSQASSAALPADGQPSATENSPGNVPGTAVPGQRTAGATPGGTASAHGGTGKRTRGGAGTKTTANDETLTLRVAHTDVLAGDDDTFTAQVTAVDGHGKAGIQVRLLDRPAGTTAWLTAATGTTGTIGDVTLRAPRLTANTAFELRTVSAAVTTRPINVTVIPNVTLRLSGTRLTVTALAASTGNTVVLQRLSGETWTDVTSERLDADREATFSSTAGDVYRVMLEATATHGSGTSNEIKSPVSAPGSTPSATATASSSATPQ
jgi:hypothetical protein